MLAGGLVVAVPAAGAFRSRPLRSPRRFGGAPAGGRPTVVAWLAVAALIVALELVTLFAGASGARHAFPTVSSLYDAAARARAAKALLAVVWLGLGWSLFRR